MSWPWVLVEWISGFLVGWGLKAMLAERRYKQNMKELELWRKLHG